VDPCERAVFLSSTLLTERERVTKHATTTKAYQHGINFCEHVLHDDLKEQKKERSPLKDIKMYPLVVACFLVILCSVFLVLLHNPRTEGVTIRLTMLRQTKRRSTLTRLTRPEARSQNLQSVWRASQRAMSRVCVHFLQQQPEIRQLLPLSEGMQNVPFSKHHNPSLALTRGLSLSLSFHVETNLTHKLN